MLSWYTEFTRDQRRTFWACYGGWALDGMDLQFYTFLIPTLTALWSMSQAQAGIIASSALITSALGGWLTGILADRYGRVRMLQITILWYSVFTAASGLTNSFGQLLVMRSLQGFGFGGEWTAGAVLVGEIVRAHHRGKAVGTLQSGWAVGWALAALLSTFALAWLPADWGWRALLFVGALPALLLLFIRRYVREPAIFLEHSALPARERLVAGAYRIFSPELLRTTILCSLLSTGALGGYYALMTWLPTYLRLERGLTILSSGLYLGVIIAGAFTGYLVGAYLADLIGRRRNFLLYAVSCIVIVAAYTHAPISNDAMLVLGFPLGFCSVGVFSGIGPFFTELFPTGVRGSGQGFSYNAGRAAGAFFPALVGFLSASLSLGKAVGLFAAVAYGLLVIAAYRLPETKGKEFDRAKAPSEDLSAPAHSPTSA
jgi:MFS family permease